MRFKLFAALTLVTVLSAALPTFAAEGKKPVKFEIQLLWGTDEEKSPDPNHKQVDPDVEKRLKAIPLKFKHYFLVNKKVIVLPLGQTKKEPVSEKCEIELKNIDNLKFELAFFGKGKQTNRRTQEFSVGEMFVQGGNAPNSTAWLVVVKRIE
jgi:hypothetical protein